MEISEVRVKLTGSHSDRVRAFCSVTFDREFVVRDIKVIEGTGGLFVAMPSRKIADHCPKCKGKNHLRARYCNECGTKLRENRAPRDGAGRSKLHADIAHPINMGCRQRLQDAILEAFQAELKRSEQPGYRPTELDVDHDTDGGADYAALIAELRAEGPEGRDRPSQEDQPETTSEPEDRPEAKPRQDEPTDAARPDRAKPERRRKFGEGIL